MERMPIQGLADAAAAVLTGSDQPNGQVRAVPDARSIRYYTTLGLIDRPAAMEGRTALYGERHLQQLVAIKRLQAEGLSLVEIQAKLHGITPRALAELAKVPARDTKSRRTAFWRQEPAPPAPPKARAPVPAMSALTGLELGAVTLLFPTVRTMDEADAEACREAAAPLLRVLEARGLI
jgi:hypothetical protein